MGLGAPSAPLREAHPATTRARTPRAATAARAAAPWRTCRRRSASPPTAVRPADRCRREALPVGARPHRRRRCRARHRRGARHQRTVLPAPRASLGLGSRQRLELDPGSSGVIARMIAAADHIANTPVRVRRRPRQLRVERLRLLRLRELRAARAAACSARPRTRRALEGYGAPGPGPHVTIYANSGHAWMTIDGRRFDTGGGGGSRWKSGARSGAGFVVRHPVGY